MGWMTSFSIRGTLIFNDLSHFGSSHRTTHIELLVPYHQKHLNVAQVLLLHECDLPVVVEWNNKSQFAPTDSSSLKHHKADCRDARVLLQRWLNLIGPIEFDFQYSV